MKIVIFILFILVLLGMPIFVFADCSKTGITTIFVNGIFSDENSAKKNLIDLNREYNLRGEHEDVTFINGFNASHVAGLGDLANSIIQAYGNNGVDYDLTNILKQVHKDLKTQKILLVGHSQGTFYTNAAYDYLVQNGIDKDSIAVYNIATPADRVAGDGIYLTSSTDQVINAVVRSFIEMGFARKPLPANIDIEIPKEIESESDAGHSFSKVYLGLVPDRIIGDMDKEINGLKESNSEKDECFTEPSTNFVYGIKDKGYKTIDNVITYFGQTTTSPFKDPRDLAALADLFLKKIYDFTKSLFVKLNNFFAQLGSGVFVASVPPNFPPEESANHESAETIFIPVQEQDNAPEELVSYSGVEGPGGQDLLDDIQERLDILAEEVRRLLPNPPSSVPIVSDDSSQDNSDDNDSHPENNSDPINSQNNNNNKASGGGKTFYEKILISEIQTAGLADAKQEFIELYNPNDKDINLTDWYLQRKTAQSSSFATYASSNLFSGKRISAKGYFLIARTGYYLGLADVFTDNPITDDNSFALKNPNGEISDKLGFGKAIDPEFLATVNPDEDQSIGRKILTDGTEMDMDNNLNDFELQTPTPKARNKPYVAQPQPGGGDGSASRDTKAPEVSFTLDSVQPNIDFTVNFTIIDPLGTVSPSGVASLFSGGRSKTASRLANGTKMSQSKLADSGSPPILRGISLERTEKHIVFR